MYQFQRYVEFIIYEKNKIKKYEKYKKNAKTTATSIPMWSPTIVLTGPDVA